MSAKTGYCFRNVIIRDNGSAKADIVESSKLKKNRQPLKKKGKICQPLLAHLK